MNTRLIDPDDSEWAGLLEQIPHDFFHLPSYTTFAARHEGGEPKAMLVREGPHELLLPLVVRPIPGSRYDATSAYGHPGPLTSAGAPAGFAAAALRAGCEFLAAEGCVALFVRLHPILNAQPPTGVGELVQHGDTVSIDLSLDDEVLERQVRRNHRQQIRQALTAGFVARDDEEWRYFDDFKRLYRETMLRLSASAYYLFDDAYFDALKESLVGRIHLGVVLGEGEVAAAMMFVETAGIVETYLSGSDEAFNRRQPTKLLYDFVRRWAKERGNRWVQLGGGYGGKDDSLLHFKSGFSPLRLPFFTLRVILDEAEYRRLSREMPTAAQSTVPGGPGEYFPAYRQR
jgi:hypothetical protein